MESRNLLDYKGKRVVFTGASSGIGKAAAQILIDLGAEVYSLGTRGVSVPGSKFIPIDLKDKDLIDAAIAQIPDGVDSLFNCAGLPGPPFPNLDTTLVNFAGHRHLTENLLPKMSKGGAIANVASLAGMGWRSNLETVKELVSTRNFDAAKDWLLANEDRNMGYLFSKQCLIYYTCQRASQLAKKEIRINCLSPITTMTPMYKQFEASNSKEFLWDYFRAPCDRFATPEEVAEPLVFLNSNLARFVSGQNLVVDYGYWGDVEAGGRQSLVG